eukprot:12167864-Prorocentrum_lima.AAC.1
MIRFYTGWTQNEQNDLTPDAFGLLSYEPPPAKPDCSEGSGTLNAACSATYPSADRHNTSSSSCT